MAKKHYKSNRGGAGATTKTANKSKVVKAVALILVILAVAYVITSLALGGIWNPLTWTKKKQPQTQMQAWGGVIDDVGNELNAETTYAMPAAMAFYSTSRAAEAEQLNLSAPSVTVTCSHNFEFNNVFVDWSIEYPSGAPATDVVTVTPTYDGSLTANVSCTAPAGFDTQLTLKATLRGNEEKTATCTIDYVKRLKNINETLIRGDDFADFWGITIKPTFGIGTISGNLRVSGITLRINDDFIEDVQKYLTFNIKFKSFGNSNIDLELADKTNGIYEKDDIELFSYSMFINGFDDYDEAHKNAIYYAWYTAYTDNWELYGTSYKNVTIDIDINVLYNGVIIDSLCESDLINCCRLSGGYYGDELSPDITLNKNNVAL